MLIKNRLHLVKSSKVYIRVFEYKINIGHKLFYLLTLLPQTHLYRQIDFIKRTWKINPMDILTL